MNTITGDPATGDPGRGGAGRGDMGEPFANEDRLPWLESADDDFREGPSPVRVIALIVFGLVMIAISVIGYNYFNAKRGATGSGELIAAPAGDYKVKPDEPGGMKVEGEGDAVFSTSEGGTPNGRIDEKAVAEAPVQGKAAGPAPKAGPATDRVVATVPAAGGRLTARTPGVATAPVAASSGGGSLVQLGSFPTEGAANTAWAQSSKRFAYLAPLGKSVERADVGGRTVYRLRVNAGSSGAANDLCGKLKIAGEACFVPN